MINVKVAVDSFVSRVIATGGFSRFEEKVPFYCYLTFLKSGLFTNRELVNEDLIHHVPRYLFDDMGVDSETYTLSSEAARQIVAKYKPLLITNLHYIFNLQNADVNKWTQLINDFKKLTPVTEEQLLRFMDDNQFFDSECSISSFVLLCDLLGIEHDINFVSYPLVKQSVKKDNAARGGRFSRDNITVVFDYTTEVKKSHLTKVKKIIAMAETAVRNSSLVDVNLLVSKINKKTGLSLTREFIVSVISQRQDFSLVGDGQRFTLTNVEDQYYLRDLITLARYKESISRFDIIKYSRRWLVNEKKKCDALFDISISSNDIDDLVEDLVTDFVLLVNNSNQFENDDSKQDLLANSFYKVAGNCGYTILSNEKLDCYFELSRSGQVEVGLYKKALYKFYDERYENLKRTTNGFFNFELSDDGIGYYFICPDNIQYCQNRSGTYIEPEHTNLIQEELALVGVINTLKQEAAVIFDKYFFKPDLSVDESKRLDLKTYKDSLGLSTMQEFYMHDECVELLKSVIQTIPVTEARKFINIDLRVCDRMLSNRLEDLEILKEKNNSEKLVSSLLIDIQNVEKRIAINNECLSLIERSDLSRQIDELNHKRQQIRQTIKNELLINGRFREEMMIFDWISQAGGKMDEASLNEKIENQIVLDRKYVDSYTSKFINHHQLAV